MNQAFAAIPLSVALLLVSGGFLASIPAAAAHGPTSPGMNERSPSDSSTTSIQFSVELANLSAFTIRLGFTANLALSGGTTSAGLNLTATASMSAPAQATLNISYLGTPVSLPINPVGILYDVPIPGLSYGYEGIAELGLFLNLSGVVLGTPSVSGPATTAGTSLTWVNSSTQDVNLTVSPNAPSGSTVTWTLSNIRYGLSMGIDAIGSVLGLGVTVPLLNFGSLGLFPGSPSSCSASYSLPGPSGGAGGGLAGGLSTGESEELVGGLVLFAVIVVGIVLVVRHRWGTRPPG